MMGEEDHVEERLPERSRKSVPVKGAEKNALVASAALS
jgi:hypothetical protein